MCSATVSKIFSSLKSSPLYRFLLRRETTVLLHNSGVASLPKKDEIWLIWFLILHSVILLSTITIKLFTIKFFTIKLYWQLYLNQAYAIAPYLTKS